MNYLLPNSGSTDCCISVSTTFALHFHFVYHCYVLTPEMLSDALFCQERGSQSASAAARAGCGSVITQCGTDASITQSQENLGGVAGRKPLSDNPFSMFVCYSTSRCGCVQSIQAHLFCSHVPGNNTLF